MPTGSRAENRRAEMNRMVQQAGASSDTWAPGAREAAGAADRTTDPGQEAYWDRADIRQWSGANLKLANELRARKGLPALQQDGSNGIAWDRRNTASPYAGAFGKPADSAIAAGYGMDDTFVTPRSGDGPAFPASTGVDPAAAYQGRYGDFSPAPPNYGQALSPDAQRASVQGFQGGGIGIPSSVHYEGKGLMAPISAGAREQMLNGYRGNDINALSPATTNAAVAAYGNNTPAMAAEAPYSGKGLMAPIPQEDRDAMMAGYQGGGLPADYLRRFRLQNR
jgi:hypothetical protein